MSEKCMEVQQVSKSFSGKKVVDDLLLYVRKGETLGLLGHNRSTIITQKYDIFFLDCM